MKLYSSLPTRLTIQSVVILCLLSLLGTSAATGQSGRKPTKPPSSNGTSGSSSSDSSSSSAGASSSSDSPVKPKAETQKSVLMIADDGSIKNDQYARAMFSYFMDRLSKSDSVSATGIGSMKKNQAIERAKSETSGWIAYIEVRTERFNSYNNSNYGSPDMTIYYTIYKAGSDKELAKGKSTYRNNAYSRGPIGLPSPGGIPSTSTPEGTAQEAANQVLMIVQPRAIR